MSSEAENERLADIKARYRAELAGVNLDAMTTAELEQAVYRARDHQFAVVMATMIGLAAKTEPDIIRQAMADVFDLSVWEAQGRQIETKFRDMAMRLGNQWADRQSVVLLERRNAELLRRVGDLEAEFEKVKNYLRKRHPKAAESPTNGTPAAETPKVSE